MLEKIKVFLASKAFGNGLWMYFLQFFNTIIPLVTLPYITRILGAEQYGVFSSSFNLVGYLQVVIEYGFSMSATREVALNYKNKNELNDLLSAVIFSRILLLIICIIISCIYMSIWKASRVQKLSYWILMIMLMGIVFQVDWLFQGLQDMKYISLTNITARIITTILIFACVNSHKDILLYCLLYSLSPVISNLIGIIFIKLKYGLKLKFISIQKIVREIKEGWYIFTTQLTSKIFGAIGVTFLTFFTTKSTVGVFAAIQKIPNILLLLWMPISQILYPIVTQKMKESFSEGLKFVLKLRKSLLLFFLVLVLILSLFSKKLVGIAFGNDFLTNYYWLIPLLFWVFFSIDNNFWGIQILLASGHDKEYSFCFQINVVITILLNFILIYWFGGLGASMAPLISEFVLDVFLIREVKKLKTS